MYDFNIVRFLNSMDDHLYRIKQAEVIRHLWRSIGLVILASMIIYIWMAYLGVGSQLLLHQGLTFSPDMYESSKFWFMIGRALFGLIYVLVIVFVPALIFKWLMTDIAFRKLMAMQLIVVVIDLAERVTWIPLEVIFGVDSFASPLSLGVIASYLTSKSWIIYFFGSVSLFQVLIILFQIKFLKRLIQISPLLIYISVIFLHIVGWWLTSIVTFISPYLIEGWFH